MNKLTNEEMQKRLDEYNPYDSKINFNLIKTYNDKNSHFICGNCGKDFTMSFNSFIKSKYKVCQNCYHKVQKTKLRNKNDVINEIKNCGYIPLFNKYNGKSERLPVMDLEGYKGLVQIYTLRNGGNIEKFSKSNPYVLDNIRLYCKINNIICKIQDQEYLGWDFPLKVICECGNEYTTTTTNLLYGNKIKCNKCSNIQSNIEKKVENWLNGNKIQYIKQYKFKNCRNKKPLPFDFYIRNIGVIEVDGIGHYEPTRFRGMSLDEAKKDFEDTKTRDNIKTKYCKDNNIKLLRIPYYDIENSENYKEILSLFVR